ncbi:MAG: triose-phosphate isomerase [Oscillospiraceae bacterium]|jgi:triosephosphate isomerase|nr:triose-phosphate isomerase [Oscillospiraceae bacterium]
MKPRKIIAGNWKMNNTRAQTRELIENIIPKAENAACEVVICVPFTDLETAVNLTHTGNIRVAAQNCHFEKSGAFTGEISVDMLKEIGAEYVVIGHSERRQYFGETDVTVNKKVVAALESGLSVIVCVGETLDEREQGITREVVARQVKIALIGVKSLENTVIAYEPVWAIGTGKTATDDQANEVCAFIRETVKDIYGESAASGLTIQYGGSMNAKNAAGLLAQPDINGGLIGGASLKAEDFGVIIAACTL